MLEPGVKVLKAMGAIAASAIPLWHLTSDSANAATLTYEMTVDVPQGNYQGTYQGDFSYGASNPLQPCQDSPTFTCATVKQNKLSVLFNFLGKIYSEKQDVDYEFGFPAVYFDDNALAGLSFIVTPPTLDISFSILGESFYMGFGVYPDPLTQQGLVGSVSYKLKLQFPQSPPTPPPCSENCVSIPEPSEIAGSALAISFLGLGLKLRQNR
ncbi:hypothetical protein AB3R30_12970 [Leptolyngbyaceae cyanobacterium UHCC 1019]